MSTDTYIDAWPPGEDQLSDRCGHIRIAHFSHFQSGEGREFWSHIRYLSMTRPVVTVEVVGLLRDAFDLLWGDLTARIRTDPGRAAVELGIHSDRPALDPTDFSLAEWQDFENEVVAKLDLAESPEVVQFLNECVGWSWTVRVD